MSLALEAVLLAKNNQLLKAQALDRSNIFTQIDLYQP